jgi:hypothetical protein
VKEPIGEEYTQLINSALLYCDTFLFVIRPELGMSDLCKTLVNRLEPFLSQKTQESEWPGTKLSSGAADIYRFKLSRDSARILTEISDKLFAWVQPNLPEDLSFLRSSGEPWLVTISHEKDGYFNLSEEEMAAFSKMNSRLILRKSTQ